MPSYSANVAASFNSNEDSIAIEIDTPANTTVKIKKIRVMHDDGTATVTSDYHRDVKLIRETAAGTGGTSFTPIKLDGSATTSLCTVKTGPMKTGTIGDTVDNLSVHCVTDFYWSAVDDDDKIVVSPGDIFAVVVNPAA
jgi:hypothetical protein